MYIETENELENDKRNNPYLVFGIEINFTILKSVFVGVASILGYLIIFYLAKYRVISGATDIWINFFLTI